MPRSALLRLILPALLAAGCTKEAGLAAPRDAGEPRRVQPHVFDAAIGGQARPPLMGASGPGHAAGLVPDPGSSAGTARYLREDGTWTVPPGSPNVIGSRTINVITAGADPTGASNASAVIQATLDAAVEARARTGGENLTRIRLYFPSGTYLVTSPIWLYDNVEVYGEGLSSRITSSNVGTFPFVAWHKFESFKAGSIYQNLPAALATDHRFDLFGVLDTSAASAAGQRWGLSTISPTTSPNSGTSPDHFLAWLGTPLDGGRGDRWYGTRKMLLSIAVKSHDGAGLGNGQICGMGTPTANGGPSSWTLWAGDAGYSGDSAFHVCFRTDEAKANGISPIRDFSFGNRTTAGVRRIDVGIDFGTNDGSGRCKLYAAVDGVQQTITRGYGTRLTAAAGGEPSFTAGDALHFNENVYLPFAFAGAALQLNSTSPSGSYANFDLLGLRLYDDWVYTDNGGGAAQTRNDALAINDQRRYFDPTLDSAHVLAYLPLNEAPNLATKTSNRLIATLHGAAPGVGGFQSWGFYCYDEGNFSGNNVLKSVRFRDISVASDQSWGSPLLILNNFGTGTDNVELLGGWWGLRVDGGYDYRFTGHLSAQGRDAAFCFQQMLGRMEAPFRAAAGRTLFRLNACQFSARDIKLADLNAFGQTTEAVVRIHGSAAYGYNYAFDFIETDNENSTGPSIALVWCQRHANFATFLRLGKIVTGNMGGSYVLFLDDNGTTGSGTGYAVVDQIFASDGRLVSVNGPSWECIVRDSYPIPDVEPVRSTSSSGTYVKIKQRLRALPKAGRILAGTYYAELWNPGAGAVETYVCTGSGTAAWDPGYTYAAGTYCSSGGVEYKAVVQNSNSAPPNGNWQTLGAVATPTWKALTTVAP